MTKINRDLKIHVAVIPPALSIVGNGIESIEESSTSARSSTSVTFEFQFSNVSSLLPVSDQLNRRRSVRDCEEV